MCMKEADATRSAQTLLAVGATQLGVGDPKISVQLGLSRVEIADELGLLMMS